MRKHGMKFGLILAISLMEWGGNRMAAETTEATVVKKLLRVERASPNLLTPDGWRAWGEGFEREGEVFVCDNGEDGTVQRGASQTVELNQQRPIPLVATVWSKAERVGGSPDSDYSLYLDLEYLDGEPLWGQIASFSTGSHDWQQRQVVVLPAKPVRRVDVHLLLRRHTGRAWFRDPVLQEMAAPGGAVTFDGVPVTLPGRIDAGFQVRDVAADSDFVRFELPSQGGTGTALGLRLESRLVQQGEVTFWEGSLEDTTGQDRAVTLIYSVPVEGEGWRWLAHPRSEVPAEPLREYVEAGRFRAGANGLLSRYPLAAIAQGPRGQAIALDMAYPAFFRVGYNSGSRELFIAYDFGLAPEKNRADFRFCLYPFEATWGFRSALAKLYEIFPDYFRCRTPEQGLWMPFAAISKVKGWEDFGFKFKEGNDETEWDDAHGIITFRYTEPLTWWMPMPLDMPRTLEAALAEARRLADQGNASAQALLTSGYHNEAGEFPARLLDTPWCNGAVWSMNSSPGVAGEVTDFRNKWNPALRERLYGPERRGDLDGEYVDSSEGYVTDELDFRRDHLATAQTPLTFSLDTRRPAVFRGLIAFEYVRALAEDVHGMGKLMMANATPGNLCWLAPWLDVMGTETDWNRGKQWRPMSDAELLYRRALCGPKPYCFLMNTVFDEFPYERVEKYMKRSLAYGMFPGFFSADASTGHYFTRPELYDRDRPLFKKYVPLCKLVAEAGWQPITRARSSDPRVYVERFGEKYLTVFNDSPETRTVTLTLEQAPPPSSRNLVTGEAVRWLDQGENRSQTTLTLEGEDVAVLEL